MAIKDEPAIFSGECGRETAPAQVRCNAAGAIVPGGYLYAAIHGTRRRALSLLNVSSDRPLHDLDIRVLSAAHAAAPLDTECDP